MKKLRVFKCQDCDSKLEKLVNDDVKTVTCDCGHTAEKTLSAPRSFGNTTGRSPSSRY